MAITSEIIGKLGGGAEFEITHVGATVAGRDVGKILHTVTVNEGEILLVAVIGSGILAKSFNTFPDISIGNAVTTQSSESDVRAAAVIEATSDIKFRSVANGESSFTASVYTVKV